MPITVSKKLDITCIKLNVHKENDLEAVKSKIIEEIIFVVIPGEKYIIKYE